jgi:hypothetical protein
LHSRRPEDQKVPDHGIGHAILLCSSGKDGRAFRSRRSGEVDLRFCGAGGKSEEEKAFASQTRDEE